LFSYDLPFDCADVYRAELPHLKHHSQQAQGENSTFARIRIFGISFVSLWGLYPVFYIIKYPVSRERSGTLKSSDADPGCLSRTPDPIFSIPDPGLTRSRIRIVGSELSEKRYRTSIPDPDFPPSRIQILDPGVKKHRFPDPDPQHCSKVEFYISALSKLVLVVRFEYSKIPNFVTYLVR
jgi:hypothetical protein